MGTEPLYLPFDLSLWDTEGLGLTAKQTATLPLSKELLLNSQLRIAQLLRMGPDAQQHVRWSNHEMRELEKQILGQVPEEDDLRVVFDTLAKVVASYCLKANQILPYPRSYHPVRTEANPLAADIVAAERIFDSVKNWVDEALKDADNQGESSLFRLALLSSITNFQLLDKAMQISFFESLAFPENSLVSRQGKAGAIYLSLAFHGQEHSESRLYVLNDQMRKLIKGISPSFLRQSCPKGVDSEARTSARHKEIYDFLRGLVNELSPTNFALDEVTSAARTVCYLRMPALVAAHRCRKFVSHAPNRATLNRIFNRRASRPFIIPPHKIISPPSSTAESTDAVDLEVDDTAQVTPTWMNVLRKTLDLDDAQAEVTELASFASTLPPPGATLAEFARRRLINRVSPMQVRRQTLLLSRRVGCRLGDKDPLTLDQDTLETVFRDALNDDWNEAPQDSHLDWEPASKLHTVNALNQFHRFLNGMRQEHQVRPFTQSDELKKLLTSPALLNVDANFITIDEYEELLTYVASEAGISSPYTLAVSRLIIVLSFRCGLRRNEVLFLRVNDIDQSDHLHVRTYDQREVKTTNSNRSLPLAVLLNSREMAWLREHMHRRISAAKTMIGYDQHGVNSAPILLFSQQEDPTKALNEVSIFKRIHAQMRAALKDESLRDHHLRHSFATLMTAKLLSGTKTFTDTFLSNHPLTCEWLADGSQLRQDIFGTSDLTACDLKAVAHLLGHGSPATSAENYVHSLDWISTYDK
jgi:integrase